MVSAVSVPEGALHIRYRDEGGYIDCYCAEVAEEICLSEFVESFYTSPLFKIERWHEAIAI
jgi:hypothetical protein